MTLLLILPLMGVVIIQQTTGQGELGPLHNDILVCTADTPGNEWVRRGIHLRRRGNCEQGYLCAGDTISELRQPCRDPTYFSVHTGTCSFPNVYSYVFGSFNCSAEENDDNLDFDQLKEKRDGLCRPLLQQSDPSTTDLYVGDPNNCRLILKCPMVAVHDDWLHMCPLGTRFDDGEEGLCIPDESGCGTRH